MNLSKGLSMQYHFCPKRKKIVAYNSFVCSYCMGKGIDLENQEINSDQEYRFNEEKEQFPFVKDDKFG